MTLRQAKQQAKKELQSEAITVIAKHGKKKELITYDISLAHRIAELLQSECKEITEGKKIKYIVSSKK